MSYYTRVVLEFSDEPPTVEDASKVVRAWLTKQDAYAVEPVVNDFRRLWTEGPTEFNGLMSHDIEGLMSSLSAAYPDLRLYVRGMGEEFSDMWLRQFEAGKVVYSRGPFDDMAEGE